MSLALGFFAQSVVEDGISSNHDNVVVELPGLLNIVGVHFPFSHQGDYLLQFIALFPS